jgi:hypothetical protein
VDERDPVRCTSRRRRHESGRPATSGFALTPRGGPRGSCRRPSRRS